MLISIIVALVSFPLQILYWIKWILAYIAISAYNATHKRRFDLYSFGAPGDAEKLGYLVPQLEIDLESPQSETHLQESVDEISFYGVNSKSECLLVRITRGSNQAAEAWIYLKLADGKTYHLSEHVNYQRPFEGKCLTFTCGNLEMHYLCPMRRWRIQFSGFLKEKSENEDTSERSVFVKFVFLWTSSSNVYDLTLDTNPRAFIDAVARSPWENPLSPPISKIPEAWNFYCQIGTLRGTFSIEDGPETELNLFGEKIRSLGKGSMIAGCHFTSLVGYVPQNGFAVDVLMMSTPKMFKNLSVGFVVNPAGDINVLQELDFTLEPYSASTLSRDFQASLTAGESYNISGTLSQEPVLLYSGEGWSGFIELSFIKFNVNNKTGYGLIMAGEVYDEQKKTSTIPPLRVLFPKTVPLTVKFSEEISHFTDISGGKGSSLGKLTKLSRSDKTFTVPKGIIVTTASYEVFVTPEIKKAVKNLENVLYGNVSGDVKTHCEMVSRNIVNTTLPDKICQCIITDLKSIFGNTFRNMKFAVRSSGTGEDTDVMSAAGQMDTFLGVKGLQEIFIAVKKCWGSQFGHIAAEYKRQNGQILNSPMAVVIQEMVACDVSGVLFTCDPVTNNPNIITITANYGLGETVVSGSVEPDTIMLERTPNDQLEIKSVSIGTKHQKIVMQDSGGVVTEDLPENSKVNTCITRETAEVLGKLAIKVEKYYRSSRDIEWGIKDGNIYLLQSRPVTSGGTVTDFEIKHEFDTALRSERDYFTVANIGEVMPGATSPLGLEVMSKYFSTAIAVDAFKRGQQEDFGKSVYYQTGMQTFYCKGWISIPEIAYRHGHGTPFSKGLQISMFGRMLNNPELDEVAKEKLPHVGQSTIWSEFQFIKELFTHYWSLGHVKKKIENYDVRHIQCKTAEETFSALMRSCSDWDDAAVQHMNSSESSSHWNTILFLLLMRAKGRFDTDVYSDFARLLATSSNIESSDIPLSLQNVANQIVKDLGADKFKSMSLEEAIQWLTTSNTSASQQFSQFLKRHGHRCLKEFDIHSIPWGQDQKLLIKLLQGLAGSTNEAEAKEEDNYSKLFSQLRVPLDFIHRLLLRIALPNCRKAVGSREGAKSLLIRSIHHMRKGYQHLGKLMVAEGRIPDANLIYFMRMDEIKELLKSRYPKIISRAIQRRKIFPILDQYKFPEIVRGFPKPINEDEDSSSNYKYVADLTMQGIPVSHGVAKGYARVALSLEEAELLKPGEILITYGTDIGWSPYFPIIAGVVTELGGLISHGAVVSREYGLPCVVGLQGATKKFRTGDFVLLDGKRGILQRLPEPLEE